jgi:hypothetical protein
MACALGEVVSQRAREGKRRMIPWNQRSDEIAALLNPAFCGTLLLESVNAHGGAMPFALGFLVLPLVLHRKTRELMPPSVNTALQVWIERNPEVKVGLAERVRVLAPFTRETLSFCLLNDTLHVADGSACLETRPLARKRRVRPRPTAEVVQCLQKAALIGRWFALSTPATTYALFGIRP